MTKILLLLGVLLASQSWATNSPDFKLAWTGVDITAYPTVLGYRLYRTAASGSYVYGTSSPNFIATIPVGTNQYEVIGTPGAGTFYFVLTTYDTNGFESDPSSPEFLLPQLPPAPTGFGLKIVTGP